jgi:magnesium-transporting ATPase (P-type)
MPQIRIRKGIADGTLIVGAIFWSLVVTFISAISNLESISRVVPALQQYSTTGLYQFANNYLAIGLLLILLAILPFIFDFIARNYEGLKTESEIQNSIMTRYFYYQLANVFVSVGLGSVATSLHEILANPSSILGILGASLPSFSIYFANLVVIKTFTAVPIEMLRVFPVLDILGVSLCMDKRKCTRRELRTGAFADPPMLYGWIYPNLMMILMIMLTYSCVRPP